MRRTSTLIVGAAIFFFTLQAVYWPLIMKPGFELHFWQMQWAADIGYRIGIPVVGVILFSPFTGLTQHLLAIGLAFGWSAAVAWVAYVGIRNFQQAPKKP